MHCCNMNSEKRVYTTTDRTNNNSHKSRLNFGVVGDDEMVSVDDPNTEVP